MLGKKSRFMVRYVMFRSVMVKSVIVGKDDGQTGCG